jgi:hypothetical protein
VESSWIAFFTPNANKQTQDVSCKMQALEFYVSTRRTTRGPTEVGYYRMHDINFAMFVPSDALAFEDLGVIGPSQVPLFPLHAMQLIKRGKRVIIRLSVAVAVDGHRS